MIHKEFKFEDSYEFAERMDQEDPLRGFPGQFIIPEGTTYLCGNCLGLQPKSARSYIEQVLSGWAEKGFRAHFTEPQNWLSYHQDYLTVQMAEIIGGLPIETSIMNSLSVNLHLMMISFYRPRQARHKILIEEGAFPSDQFVVHSQIRLHGYTPEASLVQLKSSKDTGFLETDEILSQIEEHGDELALILLGTPNFRNGQILDMESITRAGRKKGCIVGFDLAHAVGNIELRLHDWDVDFAVWCNYKYLNAGPGSLGGCFVHERYAHASDLPRLEGWWGNQQASRFHMDVHSHFEAIPGAQGWQLSSPPILSMAALRASLDIFAEAKMKRLRKKSVQLGDYFQFMLDEKLAPVCESLTPRDSMARGCQFTLRVKADSRKLQSWLLERGIVCDAMGSDMIRITPVPLYNRYTDIHRVITNLQVFFEAGQTNR